MISQWTLFAGTLAVLAAATLIGQLLRIGQILRRTAVSEPARGTVANLNLRIAAWWVLCGVMGLAMALGEAAVLAFFALVSALALREFLALIPGAPREARTRFWSIAVFVPAQYWLIWSRRPGLFSILIPVGAFLYIPVRNLVFGDTGRFLESASKSFWGLAAGAYCLSHAPAILTLAIPGYAGRNATLLFYLLLVVEASDVLQYVWGKLAGRRAVAAKISPHKTWEGFVGGVATSTALGAALYRATPFSRWQAAAVCAAITLAGFAGGMTMSAIKRNHGIKDFGTLVAGHGGIMDRIDSLCFAAPVFYYLVRYWTVIHRSPL